VPYLSFTAAATNILRASRPGFTPRAARQSRNAFGRDDREVPGLTGRFTKLDLAKAEVDKYFENIERQKIDLGTQINETRDDNNKTR